MSRQKIIAGNWKMNKTPGEAVGLAQAIKTACAKAPRAQVVVCPPLTALAAVSAVVRGSAVALGAQNMHWEKSGAYTGEVSAAMLLDLGCSYVILGHSERRTFFGETDTTVNRKVKAALSAGLIPI
ncbi:MAG: triose-phosphate isomerase, partial [bacterium]